MHNPLNMFIKVGVDACVAYSAAAGLAFLGEKQLAKKVASLQYASTLFVHTQTQIVHAVQPAFV